MSKRKWMVLLLTVILIAALCLSSCNNAKPSDKSGPDEGDLEPVDLIWYQIGEPPYGQKEMQEELNKYLKEKINATIDIRFTEAGASYDEKMNVIINSGE